jgi:hypothetical protein
MALIDRPLPLTWARAITFRSHPTMTACWAWIGRYDSSGQPVVDTDGSSTTARRGIYAKLRSEPKGILKAQCGFRDCVNPNHMKDKR